MSIAVRESEPVETAALARARSFVAIANRVAGTANKLDLDALEAQMREVLGDRFEGMRTVDPDTLDCTVKSIVADRPDALIVVGGDGTARCAAKAAMAAPGDTAIVPLPAGTMNVLPRLVFGHDDLARAVSQLDTLEPSFLPAGVIGGEPFFLSAAFGFAASLARLRESMRRPRRWPEVTAAAGACVRASVHALRGGPDWRADGGKWKRAHTLIVALQSVSRVLAPEEDHPEPRRFEIAALRLRSTIDALRLGGVALTSDWRRSKRVEIVRAGKVELRIRSSRPLVVLDGEPIRVARVDEVTLVQNAVPVLAPPER